MDPKVSVIVPTKNRAYYLSQAVRSILSQTFREYEILVIDGASVDNTRKVINEIIDPRINYVRQEEDRGVSAARNLGIVRSRGRFIAFLDDDDLWLPRMLEKQLELINRKASIGAVCTSEFILRDDGKLLGLWHPSVRGDVFPRILERNYLGNCSGMMVRKICFDRTGLFDENLTADEDWDMWIRLAKYYELDYTKEPMYIYRVHEKRITNDLRANLQAHRLLFEKLSAELKKSGNESAMAYWHYGFGKLYCKCRNMRKGREEFTRALNVNPRFITCYLRLLASFFGTKLYDTSGKILDAALPFSFKSSVA
jgi:glycosyltransferase involved in cell wall biosynthesis